MRAHCGGCRVCAHCGVYMCVFACVCELCNRVMCLCGKSTPVRTEVYVVSDRKIRCVVCARIAVCVECARTAVCVVCARTAMCVVCACTAVCDVCARTSVCVVCGRTAVCVMRAHYGVYMHVFACMCEFCKRVISLSEQSTPAPHRGVCRVCAHCGVCRVCAHCGVCRVCAHCDVCRVCAHCGV